MKTMKTMDNLIIKTNNHYRPLVYGHELTEKERVDFDYFDKDELDNALFFRYKGSVYTLGDFMACHNNLKQWDGIHAESFFSGILVKLSRCNEFVKVACYYS